MLVPPLVYDRIFNPLTYIAWCMLAIFLFTYQGLNALFHLLILLPGLYYTFCWLKYNQKEVPKSAWSLLAFILLVSISVIINRKIRPIGGTLYFLGGILAIAPTCQMFTSSFFTNKKRNGLLLLFFICTTIAHLVSFGALFTDFNYFKEITCSATRACGMSVETIAYAHFSQLLALLSWGVLINYKNVSHFINKNILIISGILSTVALYLAQSRGALLGFVMAVPLLFWKQGKKYILPLYGLSLAIIATIILMISLDYRPQFLGHYATKFENEGSNMSRIRKYQMAYYTFKENPAWGIGYRTFKIYAAGLRERYNIPNTRDLIGNVHNSYLEILVGCGIIGFLAFIVFKLFWLIEILQSSSLLISLFLPIYAAFTVSSLFLSTIVSPEYMFFLMGLYTLFQVMRLVRLEK